MPAAIKNIPISIIERKLLSLKISIFRLIVVESLNNASNERPERIDDSLNLKVRVQYFKVIR